ncbi:MAG: alpha/beta fold hydrolase [Gemmatimonadota bacterium]
MSSASAAPAAAVTAARSSGKRVRSVEIQRDQTTIRGHRIHSLRAGSGPPVILLHGLAGSSAWWRYTMPALAPRFETHAPDLIGFGSSRGKPLSLTEAAAAVHEWMTACGIARAHVIGHSMGGQIAIHLATEPRTVVQKLVLVSAAGIPRPLTVLQVARFVAEIMPPRSWGAPGFLPRIALDSLRAGPRVVARATWNILRDDVRPLLPLINVPTLLVWGTLDALTPPRDGDYMAAHIPNARLLVFEGAAHIPMVDEPARFNSEVISFLSS